MKEQMKRSARANAQHSIDSAVAVSEYEHTRARHAWQLVRLIDGVVLRKGPTRESVARYLRDGLTVTRAIT